MPLAPLYGRNALRPNREKRKIFAPTIENINSKHTIPMKSIFKKTLLAALPVLFMFSAAIAQPPPPPDDHGQEGDQTPTAPIGSGMALLLAMGAAYGAKKVYDARKKIRE